MLLFKSTAVFWPSWCPAVLKEVSLNFPAKPRLQKAFPHLALVEGPVHLRGIPQQFCPWPWHSTPVHLVKNPRMEETRSVAGFRCCGPSCSSAQGPDRLQPRLLLRVRVDFFSRGFSGDESSGTLLASEKVPSSLSFVCFSCFAPQFSETASVGFLACSCQGRRDAHYLVVLSVLTGNGGLASKSET